MNNKITIPKKQYVASFDVHAQKTFTPLCPDELPVKEGDQIVNELNAQAKKASLRIGSKEAHNPNAVWVATEERPTLTPIEGKNVNVTWPPHSIVGSEGFKLIDGLPNISDYDYFIWEGIELDLHPYGACYHDIIEKLSTGVIEFLHIHHINTVIVGGLTTDYCVKTTALQLRKAQFTVILNLAACRGVDENTMQQALKEMEAAGVIFVDHAEDISNESE